MDFSNPFTGMVPGRKLNMEEILRALRLDVAAELDAINLYQAHIDAIDDPKVNAVIAHIRDEEKEHAAEFMSLINELDLTQAQKFAAEHNQAIESGHEEALPVGPAAAELLQFSGEKSAPSSMTAPQGFTVGSLLDQEQ
ncbi:MAG: demethoxyubiquinone hydroxylase family protein [Chloroflexi bacterium]|nr:demethoxyubiquinone hydroxylase family protein [Chloroflexota bacterium]